MYLNITEQVNNKHQNSYLDVCIHTFVCARIRVCVCVCVGGWVLVWVCVPKQLNKRYTKPKGQSRMDNPEKLATLGTQEKDNQNIKRNTI